MLLLAALQRVAHVVASVDVAKMPADEVAIKKETGLAGFTAGGRRNSQTEGRTQSLLSGRARWVGCLAFYKRSRI